jgi:hypothetical protein
MRELSKVKSQKLKEAEDKGSHDRRLNQSLIITR